MQSCSHQQLGAGKAERAAHSIASPFAHMRTRLPTVWSSRWIVKVPALATLVSGLNAALPAEGRQVQRSAAGDGKRRRQRRAAAVPSHSLLDAIRHHEFLLPVWGVHVAAGAAGKRRRAGRQRWKAHGWRDRGDWMWQSLIQSTLAALQAVWVFAAPPFAAMSNAATCQAPM